MKKIKEMKKLLFLMMITLLMQGCSKPVVQYNPNDFMVPNKVVTQTVTKPALPNIDASYGIGNDPAIVKAYERYQKTGVMSTVKGDGWVTYPYSSESKPIIACSVYHFCIVQLESGEKLNSYGLGDTDNWQTNAFITGQGATESISIQMKPARNDLSTDLTISTNKRTYLIGLVAKPEAATTVLRFYYPMETMLTTINAINNQQTSNSSTSVIDTTPMTSGTQIDINHMNFNYRIKGDNTPWRPLRVFDDGNKTYIEMPAIAAKFTLPVLYLARDRQMQLVNYRYEQPYFIVDGLFSRAWLVSGKGHDQERVEILNPSVQE